MGTRHGNTIVPGIGARISLRGIRRVAVIVEIDDSIMVSSLRLPDFQTEALDERRRRFVARVFDESLRRGWTTAEQFIDWFPPSTIVDALEAVPEVRTRLLVEVAGIPSKLASNRTPAAARDDLELALEEGLTDASRILQYVSGSVLVRCLEVASLWKFATSGDWLSRVNNDPSIGVAALERVTVILSSALAEQLVNLIDLMREVPLGELSRHASPEQLRSVFQYALWCAESRSVPDPQRLLELINAAALFSSWPVSQTWQRVIVGQIALPCGLESLEACRRARDSHLRIKAVTPTEAALLRAPIELFDQDVDFSEPVDAARPRAPKRPSFEDTAPDLPTGSQRTRETARRAIVESKLRKLDRLPTNHQYLSLAILRSIAVMYEEIGKRRGKVARAHCIRECFANEMHLRTAMRSLMELLDPNTSTLVADATTDSLIEALLGQERAIWQRARSPRTHAPASDNASARRTTHIKPGRPPPVRPPAVRPPAPSYPTSGPLKPTWRH